MGNKLTSKVTNEYGLIEIVNNVFSLILTKLFNHKIRILRFPFFIRGKSAIDFNIGFSSGYSLRIEAFNFSKKSKKTIIFGENVKVGDYVHIAAAEKIIFGDNCLIASKVFITDLSHGSYKGEFQTDPNLIPDHRSIYTQPVIIGKNVWIGENVVILPGTRIGDNSIIGANSLVNSVIEKNSIAVGTPAKVIKKYNFKENKWIKVL